MSDNELSIVFRTQLEAANKKMEQLISTLNKGTSATNKLNKTASNISKAFNFASLIAGAKKLFNIVLGGIHEINSYSETLNMFNLVMGDVQEKANKFQKTMAENFGNDSQKQLYYQSLYQSLTESMGMQEKYAYIISENMTKLAYDLSSLYDKDQKDVAEALRSGLIGQTKPVRAFGLDITEASLQPILDSLGIDRTVRELSQAEKEIVRYLALIRQSVIAHGDMANTIESPANQLRIFKNQLIECHRWFGALFINLFGKAMPFINGFIMAITEIMKALGGLFGIEVKDYNSGLVAFEDELGDYVDEVGTGADKSKKKVKELKREILGFDQINNINENNDDSSDSGSGYSTGAGGIDQRLLDALKGYENGMENVRMKALDIRDAIMKWLGFTYDNEKGIWRLNKGITRFKVIVGTIATILGVLIGSKIVGGILTVGKAFYNTYKFVMLFGKALSSLFTGSCSLALKGTAFQGISNALATASAKFTLFAESLGLTAGSLLAIIGVIVAVAGALVYAYNHSEAFREKVNELGKNVVDIFHGIYDVIVDVSTQIWEVIEPIWNIIKDTVILAVQYIYENIVLNFSNALDMINGTIKIIKQLFEGDFEGAINTAIDTVKKLKDNWVRYFENIGKDFKSWTEKTIKNADDYKEKFIKKINDILDKMEKFPEEFGKWVGKAIADTIKLIEKTDWGKLGKDIKEGIINGFKNSGKKKLEETASSFKKEVKKQFENGDWLSTGLRMLQGIIKGMNPVTWGSNVFSKFIEGFIGSLKEALDIHSPSKKSEPLGRFVTLGIVEGMLEEIPTLQSTANQLLDGLNTTFTNGMQDLSLESAIPPNLSQDVSNISTYKSNTNINYNMLEQASYNGFAKAVRQYGLVNINVKQDKGSIVETAIEGINNITKQTGENPIELW